MFLKEVKEKNEQLVQLAFELHQSGKILPDSYLIDVDQLMANSQLMINEAKKQNIELYFMTKQIGRNPYLAKRLVEIGYQGAVVVDYKEALVMMKHQIPIMNIGNLVQIPNQLIKEVLEYGVAYITIFSFEKLSLINEIAELLQIKQKVLIKVVGKNDMLYSGQESGIELEALASFLEKTKKLKSIQIAGFTSFPCFLYNEKDNKVIPTNNIHTMNQAKEIARNCQIDIININLPSATSTHMLKSIKEAGGTSGEPGHGLTGTTPAHKYLDLVEKPSVVYVSEVSHHYGGHSYCYGGGHYRRSNMKHGLIGKTLNTAHLTDMIPPSDESIDYHIGIKGKYPIGDTVVMSFRFQIFVTRSEVVLIEGLHHKQPKIIGVYSSLGELK